jgi:hypothetical protein
MAMAMFGDPRKRRKSEKRKKATQGETHGAKKGKRAG